MKTITKYILMGMIVLITSCSEDFVELTNPNQLTTGSFWQTEDDALQGTVAIYQSQIYDGTYMRKYPWMMDVRSDDSYNTTPFDYGASSYTTYTINEEMSNQPWECNYIGIWRANQLLDNIGGIEMNEELKNRCIGEAKFLRGLCYFNLLNAYNNIVLIDKTPESAEDYYIPQSPSEEVWDLVYQDFQDAIDLCWTKGETRSGFKNDLGRATKGAAAAFLARAYLMNQRYSDAAPVLRDIISTADGGNQRYAEYSLVDNYRDNFTEENENNSESIFEIQFDLAFGSTQGWVGDPAPDWQKTDGYNKSLAPQPFGWGDVAPSVWIWNEFHKEKTIDNTLDPRLDACLYYPHPGDTSYQVYGQDQSILDDMGFAQQSLASLGITDTFRIFIRKYLTEDPALDEAWKSGINRRVVRYADVLLLYAECLNEAGQTTEAYDYIQIVRDRANLPELSIVKPGMSQEEMRWQISHERALELCFETWRYIDLLRWGWFEDEAMMDTLLNHDPEFINYYNPDEGVWLKGREYIAIPPSEVERTNGIVQQSVAWDQ